MTTKDSPSCLYFFYFQVNLHLSYAWLLLYSEDVHHDRGAPSHCFRGRDQALSPAGVLDIKFLHGCCPLLDKSANVKII